MINIDSENYYAEYEESYGKTIENCYNTKYEDHDTAIDNDNGNSDNWNYNDNGINKWW